MMIIESKNNPRFKEWKKLLTKKGRKEQDQFLMEGEHLVEEALKSGWAIKDLIFSEEYIIPEAWRNSYPILIREGVHIPSHLFMEISETKTPQGVAVVVKKKTYEDLDHLLQRGQLLLIIDQIQDPGNLGTIIRTADAAGIDGIILGKGTVDHYSGKVLRSTQGSNFHLPIYEYDLVELIPKMQSKDWNLYGTSLKDAKDYREIEVSGNRKLAFLVGNEGEGVQEELLQLVDQLVKIPIWGRAESLNVAIATGILLYHVQTQVNKGL
jgi:TrmH family RNA methyltransferase